MSKRGELLKKFSEKGLSASTMLLCSGAMKNMTDKSKEESAGRILTILNESRDEQTFIESLRSANIIE